MQETWTARIRRGCREAFSHWIDHQQPKLLGYAQRKLGNPEDALDVVQETFVAAFQSRERAPQEANGCQAWLFGIARNKVVDHLRKRSRLPSPVDLEGNLSRPLAGSADTAEVATDRVETQRVLSALERIDEPFREALILVSVEGLSYQEVAAVQGVPKGTIRSRVSTARSQLRAALGQTSTIRPEPQREEASP